MVRAVLKRSTNMLDGHACRGSREFYIILLNDVRLLLDCNFRFGTLALRGVCGWGWGWSFCLGFRLQWTLICCSGLHSTVLAFFGGGGFNEEAEAATSTGPPACFFLGGICKEHKVVVFSRRNAVHLLILPERGAQNFPSYGTRQVLLIGA
jgi:hypothetical protein